MLTLDDGREVVLGSRTAGGSKNETRYGQLGDGRDVVVKIETAHGRLSVERAALAFAQQHGVPVPRLVADGTTAEGQLFLVLSREDGIRAKTPGGWHRLGRDLASLTGVPIDDCPLRRVSPREFADDHRKRLSVVEPMLDGSVVKQIGAAVERIGDVKWQTLTHGDPGSGNYLDSGGVGVILDWEDATVAPFGIDVGRAAFIAVMDLGHTGRPTDLHDAVVQGYRDALPDAAGLSTDILSAATIVAGLQFIHGRFVRPLRAERTPQAAAAALDCFLARSA